MRISWVDNLRWLWIVLIVAWHCFFTDNSLFVQFIFTFHVALFFFLSGYLFNDIKHIDFVKFTKDKFYRLIIPFLFFNFVMFAYYKARELTWWDVFFIDFDSFIKWVLYASYLPTHKEIILTNIPTWFLVSLFIVSIYYFIINKYIKHRFWRLWILILLSLAVFIESKYIVFRLPFSAEISIVAMLFYGIWHSFKSEISCVREKIDYRYLFLIPFLIWFNIYFINHTNFSSNYYGDNFILFILNWLSWIFLILIIAKLIKQNFILDFLWKNSILILGFEWMKFLFLSFIIKISFWYIIMEKSYITWFIQLFCTLLFLSLWIIIYDKIKKYLIWLK